MVDATASEIDVPRRRAARWQDYLALMKPRVMSLVVFTAIVGLVAAPTDVNPFLAIASILAIAVGAGASGALNMWYDSDIDGEMKRTRMRPVPAGVVARDEALTLGLVMSALSVTTLALSGGYVAAGLLAFTIVFYAVVYTMWLKRSTPQNIVIGGLAGALPPVIAWAATGSALTIDPWLLVAIIFIWTPPHFWALCLYKAGDYAAANIPMMPNVAGAKSTRMQILAYSLALAPIGFAPALTGLGGSIYAAVSALAGAVFVLLAWRVYRSNAGEIDARPEGKALYESKAAGDKAARDLFAFSLLYLTVLFLALLVEHGFGLFTPVPWAS
jgi:protoheme IX farnesyltransferase